MLHRDAPACRFFDSKTVPSETPSEQKGAVSRKTTTSREPNPLFDVTSIKRRKDKYNPQVP